MNKLGLIGRNISYSFSQKYFTEKFQKLGIKNYDYQIFDLQNLDNIDSFFSQEGLKGFNVTIPYKQEIIPFLDELSLAAQKIGAVNCVVIRDNKKIGYNTDSIGFKKSLIPLLESHHKNAIILGDGGASKAVEYVLNELNIKYIIVSRKGEIKFEDLNISTFENHQIIINTTPVGTFPNINDIPNINTEYINSSHLVYDLIYNPEETLLLKKSKERGAKIKNGLEMLENQADEAWELWKNA